MPRDRALEALERRDYPTPETSRGIDYTPPEHWDVYPDGVRLYRGGELVWTITKDQLDRGLRVDIARVG